MATSKWQFAESNNVIFLLFAIVTNVSFFLTKFQQDEHNMVQLSDIHGAFFVFKEWKRVKFIYRHSIAYSIQSMDVVSIINICIVRTPRIYKFICVYLFY